MFVCDILHYNTIVLDDISYQIKPFNKLDKNFFTQFVHNVVKDFDGYKLALNGFIGILSKMFVTTYKNYFTQDKSQALNVWLSNPEEIEMTGIYNCENDMYDYDFYKTEMT